VRCCEKSGDRSGSTRGGPGDGHAGTQRATRVAGRAHERDGVSVCAAAGSRSRAARSHRGVGAPPPAVRRRHDLPEAATGSRRGNHKRVDRLYAEARRQVRRRRRKKVPLADRQPLARPHAPNEVWSADFVFDCTADGRVLKCLTIVDDATTEAVAVVPARALGGLPVTRVLDALASTRGLPQVLRTDNGLPQKSRGQSFSDLTRASATQHDANRQAVPPSRNHTLTIVTQGQVDEPALTGLNRASYSRWKVRA